MASVGSGPAIDVARAAATLPDERRAALRVTLLDLDPAALDAARQRLEPLVTGDGLACVRTNLYRLAQAAAARESWAVPISSCVPVSSITWRTGRPPPCWRSSGGSSPQADGSWWAISPRTIRAAPTWNGSATGI